MTDGERMIIKLAKFCVQNDLNAKETTSVEKLI